MSQRAYDSVAFREWQDLVEQILLDNCGMSPYEFGDKVNQLSRFLEGSSPLEVAYDILENDFLGSMILRELGELKETR